MHLTKKWLLLVAALIAMLALSATLVDAGNVVLNNNSGDASATFFITGEQTLVINGFDLSPLGLALPATIDKVSIAVDTAVPGATVTAVVYEDANGGSPVDATLAGQAQVSINGSGVFTATFPTPITVNAPVVWVGFYLPVNFRFLADQSGSSVLTYWAWTPGGTFDLSKLSSASVLGPANGTAPVNLNMNGVARITAEITGGTGSGTPGTIVPTVGAGTPGAISQVVATGNVDTSMLRVYPPACDTLFWDSADVGVSYQGSIDVRCTAIWPGYAPSAPLGYNRQHLYYDLTFYDNKGNALTGKLALPVTHCIQANAADIDRAVVALAYGSPRVFEILPTLRVGNLICAEVWRSGGLSYLVPA
jgi:hypothetical protein